MQESEINKIKEQYGEENVIIQSNSDNSLRLMDYGNVDIFTDNNKNVKEVKITNVSEKIFLKHISKKIKVYNQENLSQRFMELEDIFSKGFYLIYRPLASILQDYPSDLYAFTDNDIQLNKQLPFSCYISYFGDIGNLIGGNIAKGEFIGFVSSNDPETTTMHDVPIIFQEDNTYEGELNYPRKFNLLLDSSPSTYFSDLPDSILYFKV